MSVLKIARMGHPILRRRAEPVADPRAPEVLRLVRDMIETLEEERGVGLAAPQVFVPLRLVIFYVPGERGNRPVPLTVLSNPEIEPLSEAMTSAYEGCLSIPGMTGAVPRFDRIRYRGLDLGGREIDREAEGFHARVVQHECDHLDGVLYPTRMADLSTFGFTEEIRRGVAAADGDSGDEDPSPETAVA
ncbi:MAG: peptide deformylase [Alphaproteobacteria bacterium]